MSLAKNIHYLRKKKNLTQEQLARKLGLNRPAIGAYEEGRAEPRLKTLRAMAHFFEVSLDQLVGDDLSGSSTVSSTPSSLRILSVTVDSETGRELIPLVPVKAAAGYLNGYGDIDYVESLPQFQMPFPELGAERSYRIFQTRGDSMLPVPHGAYIIGRFVEDWQQIKSGECYVLVTLSEGVVYKRVYKHLKKPGVLVLHSDNREYSPYEVPVSDVREVWEASGFTSFQLPRENEQTMSMQQLTAAFLELKKEISEMKSDQKN
jgi:transcriptional regulator with XRE-family HTH domain